MCGNIFNLTYLPWILLIISVILPGGTLMMYMKSMKALAFRNIPLTLSLFWDALSLRLPITLLVSRRSTLDSP